MGWCMENGNMTPTNINILQITDSHLFADINRSLLGVNTYNSFQAVVKHIAKTLSQYDPQLIVFSGDLSQDDSRESYQHIINSMSFFPQPIAWLPGNHDKPNLMHELFNGSRLTNDKHFILKPWQIILLDSHWDAHVGGRLSDEQLYFLNQTLASYAEYAVIFLHHHVQPVNSQWLDEINLQNSADFLAIIAKYPQVRGVVSGHVHQDSCYKQQQVTYVTTPSTCIQFKPTSANFALDMQMPGYRYISLSAEGDITTKLYRVEYDASFLPDKASKGY